MVVKKKMADISLFSRVRTTAGIIAKNMAKTARRQLGGTTSALWRKLAELDKPQRTLSKMNLTSMQVSMFQPCF